MSHRLLLPLRVLLAGIVLALLAGQAFALPAAIAPLAAGTPWVEDPFLVLGVLGLACGQAVVVCTWQLLDLAGNGRLFTDASSPWVDAIVRAVTAAAVLALAAAGVTAAAGAPVEVTAVLAGLALLAAALVLLVVVMRVLLHQATTLRADLDEVI